MQFFLAETTAKKKETKEFLISKYCQLLTDYKTIGQQKKKRLYKYKTFFPE